MNRLLRCCFLCVTFFAFGIIADAQEEFTGKVDTKYDQSKNETEIEVRNIPLSLDKGRMAFLSVSISFAGNKMKRKPDDVIFIVALVNAKGHRFADINKVALTSGGSDIGQMTLLNLDQREFSPTEILETIGTRMKMDVFHKVAASKQAISFKIEETTLTIEPANISKLTEFEKAITP